MMRLLATAALSLVVMPALADDELVELVKKVQPAVARINTDRALGSGVIINDSGLVVTNYHVVERSRTVKVVLASGKALDVRGFLAADMGRDLALLKVDPLDTPCALRLLDGRPQVGEKVAAFGNPQGFSFSTSEGIVAAVRSGQEVSEAAEDLYRALGYDFAATWVQTTAPISPGNSGGPLVNMKGEVVGLNTWHKPDGQNLNFAIASVDIQRLLQQAGELRDIAKLPKRKGSSRSNPSGRDKEWVVSLPTGRTFSFGVFLIAPSVDIIATPANANGIAVMRHANGKIYATAAQTNGILDGVTAAYYDNGKMMTYAMYSQGKRHGLVKSFDEAGVPAFFAQYIKGKPHGFCCYFDEDEQWLLCEYDQGELKWIQVIGGLTLGEGFSDRGEAEKNTLAKQLLDRMAETEEKLKVNELLFKKQVKEHNLRLRKLLSVRQSVEKRKKLLAEIDKENAANAAFHTQMLRQALSSGR